ncbi:MAG: hypothetical protein K0Q70_101 [Rhodospirillales bacterium]|jgi:hypothetical protein|nr:hypothetical protein [Rhodospirillales bacterium]
MDGGAIELVSRVFRIEAVVLTACGLFLIFLDINSPSDPSGLRRRLTAIWRAVAATPVREVPGFAVAGAMRAVDRFIIYWFEQSERNVVTAGTFTLIVFIAIPIAALLNWLRGGSPTLLLILLVCAIGTIALAVLSELKRSSGFTRVLSALLFAAIFLVVPIYVFVSLTDRTLNMPIGHGALASVLLTPVLYIVCHSAILLGVGTSAAPVASLQATVLRRLVTLFIAALPFAYLGTFGALLVWHLLEPEAPVPSTWRTLLITAGCGAVAAACSGYLATPRPRTAISPAGVAGRLALGLGVACVLAAAAKLLGGWSFAKPFVLSALPLVASALLIAIVVLALCSKAVLRMSYALPGTEAMSERPYRVAGILILLVAVAAGWASVAL